QVRRDVDTQLQLRFGQAPTRPAPQRDFWSSFPGVRCVYRHSGVIPHSSRNAVGSSVTVEAWVQASGSGAETPQTLVAKWSLRQTMTAAAFDAVDVGRIDGLDTTGYFGAIFDGRYVYFAP